jgi:hypothetical protein
MLRKFQRANFLPPIRRRLACRGTIRFLMDTPPLMQCHILSEEEREHLKAEYIKWFPELSKFLKEDR